MDQIGKYKILEKIGQGAASTVYKGFDADLGRYVAIKTISADAGGDETLRKRFEREAQSAARLAHPHIITVYDFGQEHDKLFMAMELLEGVDLKQAIIDKSLATLDQKLEVMEQICEGLAFAHANEIIHRDLKPANIRLLADGQVKIMDFGLARSAGSDMTRTGLVMGTPYYMSPEQMRGEHVDTRSDVFSLGCVFYELLTGAKPFDAESLHSVLYKVLKAEPRPAKELVPGLPGVIAQLLDRALAKDRAQRYSNGGELLRAVQAARAAIAGGRGEDSLAGFEAASSAPSPLQAPPSRAARPEAGAGAPPSEVPRSAALSAVRRPNRSTTMATSAEARTPAPPRSRVPIYLMIGGMIAVLFAGGLFALWTAFGARAPKPTPSPPSPQIDALARAAVATQVELARKKLDNGDYDEAVRRAEWAQTLAPSDEDVQKVLREAKELKGRVDQAVADVRAASGVSDPDQKGRAYWRLLEVAPDHALAVELGAGLDPTFRPRAEEAQRLMAGAQKDADKARAARFSSFQEGVSIARSGEAALRERRFAAAAREFMRARARFERAQRSVR